MVATPSTNIAILVCDNLARTEKRKIVVIGKLKHPRHF